MYKNISVKELKKRIGSISIIDIRDSSSYNMGAIPTSKNIPYYDLVNSNYLNNNDTYYIYCNQGITSIKACNYLSRMGYKVVNVDGGYKAYLNDN